MKFDISGNPDFGDLTIVLEPGESIWCESGAMNRMSRNLAMKSKVVGGMFRGLIRKLLGGESFFLGEYTAEDGPGFIGVSPAIPGSVIHRTITQGQTFVLTAGAFLASTPGITVTPKFGGFRALFSGEGAFVLEVSGEGELFFNAYGGIVEKTVDGELIVDTGHVVAWEPTLAYRITGMGGFKQTLFSGEGLVMRFTGQGKLWVQSRHMGGLAGWLRPYCW